MLADKTNSIASLDLNQQQTISTTTTIVVEGYCKLYAVDNKILRVIEDESSADFLQRNIDSFTYWNKE